jgi:hypothetical protein
LVAARDQSCRSSQSAPNIEDMHSWSEVELGEKILGSLAPTDVKLVDWSEIVDRYGIGRSAQRLQTTPDRIQQITMSVVT